MSSSSTLVVLQQQQQHPEETTRHRGGSSKRKPQQQQQVQQQQQHVMEASTSLDLLERVSEEIERMRAAKARHCKRHRSAPASTLATTAATAVPAVVAPSISIPPPPLYHSLPSACMGIIQSMLPGNHACMDCGAARPQWAAVSYGALLCLQCSGRHRSLGVNVSCVRSLSMDEWSLEHIVAMLEGGNAQLQRFFERHHLTVDVADCIPNNNNNSTSSPCNSSDDDEEEALSSTSSNSSSGSSSASSSSGNNNKLINKKNVTRLRYKTKAALFYRQQMTIHVRRILKQPGPYRGREVSRQQRDNNNKGGAGAGAGPHHNHHHKLQHRNSTV